MIIQIDAENAFDDDTQFMIKISQQTGVEGKSDKSHTQRLLLS